MPMESRPIKDSGLVISRGRLGWTVHGYVENKRGQFIGSNAENLHNELDIRLARTPFLCLKKDRETKRTRKIDKRFLQSGKYGSIRFEVEK